jgi:hypothetical protein
MVPTVSGEYLVLGKHLRIKQGGKQLFHIKRIKVVICVSSLP